jgi:hypothetical protein
MNAKHTLDLTMELGRLLANQEQLERHLAYNNKRFIKCKRAGQHGNAAVFDKVMSEDLRIWRGRRDEIIVLRKRIERQGYQLKHLTPSGHMVRL